MQNAPLIPDDLAACQDLLRDSLARLDAAEAQCQQAYATGESLHSKLLDVMQERDRLKETIERLLHQLYGRRSERHPDLADVDYGELPAQDPPPPPPDPPVGVHDARKTTRTPKPRCEEFPDHLERRDEVIDVPESERAGLVRIGEDVTERLEFDRPKPWVRRIIRPKYVRPGAPEAGVVQAAPPLALIEGGRYGFSVAAEVLFHKYAMHSPLYRQQNYFAQIGWTPSRSTMCQLTSTAGELLRVLAAHLVARTVAVDLLGTDDTSVTVLTPGEGDGSVTARLWLYRGREAAPYDAYHFTESRQVDAGPALFLKNFRGTIVADAYTAYTHPDAETAERIVHAACHAHVRRKFHELQKKAEQMQTPRLVSQVLALYQLLYDIEDRVRPLSAAERMAVRQAESRPLLEKLEQLFDGDDAKPVLPRSKLGEALTYARNQRTALRRFLDDGRIPIDNNDVERDLRQVALGRKNWMFIGSLAAGERTAAILSVVGSAHRHNLDLHAYLSDVLECLARRAQAPPPTNDDLDALLPDRWKATHPEAVLKFREEERQKVAEKKKDRHEKRRREQRRSGLN